YIASQPPDLSGKTDMQKITSYLDAYTEYKLLFYMPTPTKNVYKVIREKLRNIINNDWDIALVTFLDYINKDLKNNREFYRLIGFAYTEAIEKGRLHLIEILYQKYDMLHAMFLISKAAKYKQYDIVEYLLSLPEFQNESLIDRGLVIRNAARSS